jgi:integrase/recombinase XerD
MFKPENDMTTSKTVLYISKFLKNGENPVMIRVTKNRKSKYISLGISGKPELWTGNAFKRGYPNHAIANLVIQSKKLQIDNLILELEKSGKDYSLEELEHQFMNKVVAVTVFSYCEQVVSRLKETGRVGNASAYNDLLRRLKSFRNNKDLQFSDITYNFLVKFDEDFRKRGTAEITISFYMRTLRALINRAIKEGYCKESNYPFKDYSISKLNTSTRKRAITKEEMYLIIDFKPEAFSSLWHSRNYFLFSFYNVGMNLKDMALLKWSDIVNGRIAYMRSKTGRYYDIKIQPRTREILDFYSKGNENTNEYIFPILDATVHKTPQSIKDRVHKINKRVNRDLKTIADQLGIQATHSITHYVARHSWASIQKHNGTDISVISESMGHNSEKTTQIYLQSFVHEVLDEANASLI